MKAKSSIFRFKQFAIRQDKTAMKVGTDGVLIGAWCQPDMPKRILDVGTGTGLIALIMAQKFPVAQIDAVEIETAAAEQAFENFQNSPWKNNLHLIHHNFLQYSPAHHYDCIISNPPYFDEDITPENKSRQIARHTHSLSLKDFIEKSQSILSPQGNICLILPVQKEKDLQHILSNTHLYINKLTYVKGHIEAPVKRLLIQLSRNKTPGITDTLVIEKERHQYTRAYITLTRDFYLKM